MTLTASVLCHGPSLRDLKPEVVKGTLVCAVNRAIVASYEYANAWLFSDWTTEMAGYLPPERRKPWLCVLVRPKVLRDVKRYFKGSVRPMASQHEETLKALRGRVEWFGPKTGIPSFAVALVTMALAGYDQIDLYGADMAGSGSGLDPAWTSEESALEQARWRRERAILELLMTLAPGWGCEITPRDSVGQPLAHKP